MNYGIPPPAKCLVKRETRVVEPSPVEKFEGTVGQSGPCHRGDRIDHRLMPIFGIVHCTDLRNRSFHRLCGNEGASMDLIQPRMEASQQWTTVFGNAVISPRPLARGAVFRSGQTLQSSRSTPLGGTKRSIGSATTWPCDYRASTGPPGRSTSSTLGCRDWARSCRLPSVSRSRNGVPAEGYPCHWSVCRWHAGDYAIIERIADLRQAAIAFAPFVAPCSGSIPRAGRPLSYKGCFIQTLGDAFAQCSSVTPVSRLANRKPPPR
jgi:hypothetical protein